VPSGAPKAAAPPAPVVAPKPEPPKKEPIVIKLEAIAREDDKENLVSAFKQVREGKKVTDALLR